MSLPKMISLAFALVTAGTGAYAAHLWKKASEIGPAPAWRVEPADEMASHAGWIGALIQASIESGNMNKRAAIWTAWAVLLGTAATLVGSLPW